MTDSTPAERQISERGRALIIAAAVLDDPNRDDLVIRALEWLFQTPWYIPAALASLLTIFLGIALLRQTPPFTTPDTQPPFVVRALNSDGMDDDAAHAKIVALEDEVHYFKVQYQDTDGIAALTAERDAALTALQAVMRYYPTSQDAFPAYAVLASLREKQP